MEWGRKDRELAVRHISPGAKVGIFLFTIIAIGVLGFIGWHYLQNNVLESSDPTEGSEEILAGETFESGAEVDFFDTDTEAILDGAEQRVQAVDPSDEWLETLEEQGREVTCEDDGLCVAEAPTSLPGMSGGSGDGLFSGDGFLGTGYPIGMIVLGALAVWILYIILVEEN